MSLYVIAVYGIGILKGGNPNQREHLGIPNVLKIRELFVNKRIPYVMLCM